ncbi:hypothetical protein PHSY_002341 [Pseudozyma hubeiensis SY62]|uniref:Protein YOP1 n=1 Tax=Pseudozyma hubeiensis (strain SY62) TaxID=1305764 RepID=R9P0N1_PSEHS|nr:hypothetical protein PHSY_002341 [Pseudozyma hubeiensis SY62]GAC94768.1 hypothetical protein PHSY_002341 [Pseudozyma hubeiensis SY62]
MALLLLHLPTLALNAGATLVYPLYSSYKAVTSSTTSLADMEVWLVYWSVFACWTLLESLFGFLWSWVPFYYEIRLLFNIWLVAPQTRGATYIYTNHLHPFLQSNQEQIDAWIEDAKRSVKHKVDANLGGLWSASLGSTGSAPEAAAPGGGVQGKSGGEARHRAPGVGNAPAPPTQHNPAQAPLSLFGNLVKQYAPVAIASAKTFLESKAPPPNVAAYSIPPSSSSGAIPDQRKREEAMQRRRQLESQLAALDASGVPSSTSSSSNSEDEVQQVPVTLINPGKGPRGSFSGAAGSLRNRIVSGGRTVKAGNAMGESYDLLDQNDIQPLQGSPKVRNWMPWSPQGQ